MQTAMNVVDRNTTHQIVHITTATLSFREFPKGGDASDPLVVVCQAAASAVAALDARVGEIMKANPTLPPYELRAQWAAMHVRAQEAHARAAKATSDAERKLADDTARLEIPVPVTTVFDLASDAELRQFFAMADVGERDVLWDQMARGELPPLLAALARFPCGVASGRARDMFRDLAHAANPQKVTDLAEQTERAENWARETVVNQITAIFDASVAVLGPSVLFQLPRAA